MDAGGCQTAWGFGPVHPAGGIDASVFVESVGVCVVIQGWTLRQRLAEPVKKVKDKTDS